MKHLFDIFPSRAFAALALAAGLLAGCSKETGEWENNGRTATIALRVPMAEAAATRATEEEYQAAETKINTLRVLVISQDNQPIVNQKFDNPGSTVTIDNIPVGTVTICAIANEAALGKNYDDFAAFEADLVQVGGRDKLLITDQSRSHFPKRYTEPEIANFGLPMSWIDREVEIWSADDVQADPATLGLNGSPTRVKKSFTKGAKSAGKVFEVDANEAADLIISKLKEKYII